MEKVEKALEALRAGKLILVTDSRDRENEGDLICSAQAATTENINFMASHAKGLICMPMSQEIATRLNFSPMVANNTDNHETAFTESIDHYTTTTGISAVERGLTARMVVSKDAKPKDFRRPGHMFPLIAKAGGVLKRAGHTEATVDLMRLAGLEEAGLCCEIMADDGTMMRTEQLKEFAAKYDLPWITVEELKQYRKLNDILLKRKAKTTLPTKYGTFDIYGYLDEVTGKEHVALVKGELETKDDILCRIHSECLTGDTFGSLRCDCGKQLESSLEMIAKNGGILLYLSQEGRGIGLLNKLKAYDLQDKGLDTLEANQALDFAGDLRDYYAGAQILKDIGQTKVNLLTNNPDKVIQLERYGIKVEKRIPLEIKATKFDEKYLQTKKQKMGHLLNLIK